MEMKMKNQRDFALKNILKNTQKSKHINKMKKKLKHNSIYILKSNCCSHFERFESS